MSKQLHKNFTDEQVKLLLKSYVDKGIKINYIFNALLSQRRMCLCYSKTAPLY